jgi:hypothetical protein
MFTCVKSRWCGVVWSDGWRRDGLGGAGERGSRVLVEDGEYKCAIGWRLGPFRRDDVEFCDQCQILIDGVRVVKDAQLPCRIPLIRLGQHTSSHTSNNSANPHGLCHGEVLGIHFRFVLPKHSQVLLRLRYRCTMGTIEDTLAHTLEH